MVSASHKKRFSSFLSSPWFSSLVSIAETEAQRWCRVVVGVFYSFSKCCGMAPGSLWLYCIPWRMAVRHVCRLSSRWIIYPLCRPLEYKTSRLMYFMQWTWLMGLRVTACVCALFRRGKPSKYGLGNKNSFLVGLLHARARSRSSAQVFWDNWLKDSLPSSTASQRLHFFFSWPQNTSLDVFAGGSRGFFELIWDS